MQQIKELSIVDALILMESMDSPFHIGAPDYPFTKEHQKSIGVSDYREHDLDHGKEGTLIVYHRDHAYEIHHREYNGDDKPVSGEILTKRTGANPRYISTMGHVAKSFIESGKPVRIAGTVENGMFDKYRRLGVILAKRYNMHVSAIKDYTFGSDDVDDGVAMKEFTIHKPVTEGFLKKFSVDRTLTATVENDYYINESVIDHNDPMVLEVNKIRENKNDQQK